jgi:hypothetical protein
MNQFLKRNLGIIIGATYALILRLIFGLDLNGEVFDLFSITFIWITPIIIGLIPLLYATNEQLNSWGFRVSSPVWTVTLFFIFCFVTRIEDIICLWVLLIPYILVAITIAMISGEIILKIRNKKHTLYSIILIPFITCPIEQQFTPATNNYSVTTSVIINANSDKIWKNIVRVSQIKNDEYQKGFFNYAGIPRPLYAELNKDTLGAKRIGHFEGGLQFIETVNTWERNKHIGFNIVVVPSSIRKTIFDQHILKGNHFKFLNAEYILIPLMNGKTKLLLNTTYQVNSQINLYAAYCGNKLLTDFQERLLAVINKRCNK